jgi:hypothetical protein
MKRDSSARLLILAIGGLALAAASFAQDVPLKNWIVPPLTKDTYAFRTMSALAPEAHLVSNTPGVFVSVQPCRLTDSRVSSGGPGPIGSASTGGERTYDFVPGAGASCETLPPNILALSLNFTVLNTLGPGFLYAFPLGGAPPPVSILNYTGGAGELRNNAAIQPVDPATGAFVVGTGVHGTDVIIDLNGIFLATLEVGTTLTITSDVTAILGVTTGNANGTAGVKGMHGAVVPGTTSELPAGTVGTSSVFNGVLGITQGGSGGAAVRGARLGVTPPTSGELGAAGLGGLFFNDVEIVDGDLRVTQLDLTSRGDIEADGNLTVAGTKSFAEPHPTDPSKIIKYVSLEGPESGTYFRGRGRFQNGTARIPVPEDFRLVTAEEGLTVQITPIGGMATVGVLRMDLNEIVAQSSRNLEFSYLVQGVRRAFRDFQPIEDAGVRFTRAGANARLPKLVPEFQRRLIANGTYNADGTVNMETARRLGWDRLWAEREHETMTTQPNP